MNWEQIEGKWDQLKGKVKEQWGKLTDDDIRVVAGKKDQLLGKLRERYGYAKGQAEKEIDRFTDSCGCASEERFSTTEKTGKMCQH